MVLYYVFSKLICIFIPLFWYMLVLVHKKIVWLIILFVALNLQAIGQLKANFTLSSPTGCTYLSESFLNATTGASSSVRYTWKLGNGNISKLKNASAIYVTPKTYYITLIDSDGNKVDSVTKSIIIYNSPVASFSVSKTAGCSPLSVTVKDNSTPGSASITGWVWDFGDGDTSSSQNPPAHSYSVLGTYKISLYITDNNTCSGSYQFPSPIVVGSAPVVGFTSSSTGGCYPPQTINFTSKVTSTFGGLTYSWDFGDGGSSTSQNPSHTYTSSGSFDVGITATDSTGCNSTIVQPGFIFIGIPTANFQYSPSNGCAPLNVSFMDISTGEDPGASFFWDFGDGSTSNNYNPTHIYAVGTYSVKEIVINPSGCGDTTVKTNIIHVTKGYTASFTADSILCQEPFTTTFINTSGSNTHILFWNYGDSTNTDTTRTHTYPNMPPMPTQSDPNPPTSPYTVTLAVIDGNQCIEEVTKKDYIYAQATTANIFIFPSTGIGCVPYTVPFTGNVSTIDPIKFYSWHFGDYTADSTNVQNPGNHIYTDTGSFNVTFSVVTNTGCKAKASSTILAGDKPPVSFSGGPYSGCLNSLRDAVFRSTSNNDTSGPIKAEQYSWLFSDGRTGVSDTIAFNGRVTNYLDDKPGKYTVRLITTNNGCNDTSPKKQLITITGPWANFTVKQNDICNPALVSFIDNSLDNTSVVYSFGDGDTSSQRNPVHQYAPGKYAPSMIVYNDTSGCSDSFKMTTPIVVPVPWKVYLIDSPLQGCIPFPVTFTLVSNDSSLSTVDFGDGNLQPGIRTGALPLMDTSTRFTHTYLTRGVDTVKVRAVNLANQCMQTYVLEPPVIISGPSAKFTVDRISGCIPFKVGLIDQSGKDPTVTAKYYSMGDGNTVKVTSDTMYYTYTQRPFDQNAGYTITLTVQDPGCTNYAYAEVYPTLPVPVIVIDSDYTCTSTLYIFSPTDSGVGPFQYVWNFGDGDTSNLSTVVHSYRKDGDYRIKLKMTDGNGCTDTTSEKLLFDKIMSRANFTDSTTKSNCPPVTAHFYDESKFAYGGLDSFEWNFGDGSAPVYTEFPSKVYNVPGNYTVTLKITDSLGCVDSISKTNLISIKGATGTYTVSPKSGCVPLTVQLTAFSNNASKFSWDLGNGQTPSGSTITYTYTAARAYIPVLLLSDSFLCTYPLPAIDTINVYPLPIPDFIFDSICSGLPTYFYDASDPQSGSIVAWSWDFGDGTSSNLQNPSHIYKRNGYYDLGLKVTNSNACQANVSRTIKIGGVTAGFKTPPTSCVGSVVQFTDTSKSDTAIESRLWLFGDGDSSTQTNPTHIYLKKGLYTISLFVANYKGCVDTLIRTKALLIGDTVPPPALTLFRVTVLNDTSVEVDFSKYMDIDFGKYIIYMKDVNGNFVPVDSVSDINKTVDTISKLNNLNNIYCFEVQSGNVCNHYSPHSQEHCTIKVTAKPGIDKALISWTPYVGWNVVSYQVFRKSYYSNSFLPVNMVPGDTLTYADTDIICYKPVTYKIKAFESGGFFETSWSDTANTLPIHVPRLPSPQLTHATVPDNSNILIEWNDIPNLKIKKWIVEKSFDGLKYNILDTPFNRNRLSVTDSKVDVQNNSYFYRLDLMDSCGDISPYSNIAKTILLRADTTPDVRPYLYWTAYRYWPEGVQYYEIDLTDADGNFTMLNRTTSGNDTFFTDNVTDLNSLPGYCYRVVAHRNGPPSNPNQNLGITSISNDACVQARSRVFVPNAFTPNDDGLNDSLTIKGLFISEFHIRIYDRWGTKVFESNSLSNSWDGTFKGSKPVTDVYEYLIDAKGTDGKPYFFSGTVTVLP